MYNSTVKPLLSRDWLNIDSTANSGSGTVPQVNTGSNIPAPVVPTADPAIAYDQPNLAPDSDGVLYETSNWADAWPSFSQGDWKQGPAQTPTGDIHGEPDPYANNLANKAGTVRVTLDQYAGYNAQAQVTDTAGWKINTPSGRTATRKLLGANGVGYEDQWYQTAERPTPRRFAKVAVPNNSPDGTPGVLNGGELPNYADVSYGGPGNIAYDTPAPPQTAQPQQAQAAASANWQGW